MKLDLIQTVAFAGVALFLGYGLRRLFPLLARLNMPAPVLGGLIVSVAILIVRGQDLPVPEFDATLQRPLMVAFFTSIGFAASLKLLRIGGPQVAVFLAIGTVFAVLQNLLGAGVAVLFDRPPLFGVLAGSVTLTGGPATGLAFAPLFEAAGIEGAAAIAIAVAMAGIVLGGLVGGPIATHLIERYRVPGPRQRAKGEGVTADAQAAQADEPAAPSSDDLDDESVEAYTALKTVVVVLVAMWVGEWVSALIGATGLTLPSYIGAMIAAAAIRGIDDYTGLIGLSHRTIDTLGAITLSLFLVMALMTLDLTQLAGLALPLVTILAAQIVLVAIACLPVFWLMGRDYDAAVMGGGFVGFMLGTTANAMAVMRTLVERFGPAPRAFLVAPLVGTFFIDFTNALIITVFLNLFA
ncbi:MAG TPA: sodium/glutamate symporter [Steroidobacteraceae bacterium]|nr:sodium/glutamate symporter [Steroidobacteraceae bacterium]HNS27484.1 sodium/glutamate symporter [Steroidobacteraceae bacterium]